MKSSTQKAISRLMPYDLHSAKYRIWFITRSSTKDKSYFSHFLYFSNFPARWLASETCVTLETPYTHIPIRSSSKQFVTLWMLRVFQNYTEKTHRRAQVGWDPLYFTLALILSSCLFWFSISEPMSIAMLRKFPIMVLTCPMFSSISPSRASLVILNGRKRISCVSN